VPEAIRPVIAQPQAPVPSAGATKHASTEADSVVENELYKITFTNRGGQVKSWILKKFQDDKGQPIDPGTIQVLARRKDLSGDGKTETLKLSKGAAQLAPGRWDMALAPSPKYYAETFRGAEGMERGHADGWNEVLLPSTQTAPHLVTFRLSSSPGQLHGTVTNVGHDAVPGAPVYLEAYDVDARKRLIDIREARTDTRGQYQFYGLAPGNYRILSTFEFQAPDSPTMELAGPRTVKIEEGRDTPLDLDLYVIR
jgi:hypothetical protein